MLTINDKFLIVPKNINECFLSTKTLNPLKPYATPIKMTHPQKKVFTRLSASTTHPYQGIYLHFSLSNPHGPSTKLYQGPKYLIMLYNSFFCEKKKQLLLNDFNFY